MRIITDLSNGYDPSAICTEFESDESLLIAVALLNLEPIHRTYRLPRSPIYSWSIGNVHIISLDSSDTGLPHDWNNWREPYGPEPETI